MGMAIARLYGYNFVTVHIGEDGASNPVCTTMVGHDSDTPTLFVHYIGGKVNVSGGKATAGSVSGHYEAIVKAYFDAIPPNTNGGDTKYILDEEKTIFVFDDESRELRDFIAHFYPRCNDTTGVYIPPYAAARAAAARAGTHISVSSSSRKSASAPNLTNLPLEGGARRHRHTRRRQQRLRRVKKTRRHE
jgi:hypothetical protein